MAVSYFSPPPHIQSSHRRRGVRWGVLSDVEPSASLLTPRSSRALAFLQADIIQTDDSSVLLLDPFEDDALKTWSSQCEPTRPPATPPVPLPQCVSINAMPLHKHLDLSWRVSGQLVPEGKAEVAHTCGWPQRQEHVGDLPPLVVGHVKCQIPTTT